jgi:hypothetical protein
LQYLRDGARDDVAGRTPDMEGVDRVDVLEGPDGALANQAFASRLEKDMLDREPRETGQEAARSTLAEPSPRADSESDKYDGDPARSEVLEEK